MVAHQPCIDFPASEHIHSCPYTEPHSLQIHMSGEQHNCWVNWRTWERILSESWEKERSCFNRVSPQWTPIGFIFLLDQGLISTNSEPSAVQWRARRSSGNGERDPLRRRLTSTHFTLTQIRTFTTKPIRVVERTDKYAHTNTELNFIFWYRRKGHFYLNFFNFIFLYLFIY